MARKIPNPFGRRGGPDHQSTVEAVADDIEMRGFNPIREFFVKLFGLQKKRFIDVAAVSGDLIVEMHQVGKVNKNGLPVKRERDVIQEIKNELDIDIIFHPYNKTAGDNYESESD